MRKRAIITIYNRIVNILNKIIPQKIEALKQKYLSPNYISKVSTFNKTNAPLYWTEFLNALKFTCIPNHKHTLKLGCVIMLIRNISQANKLCNTTRLIVIQMHPNILEARIVFGSNLCNKVYIPGIIMPMQKAKWPFFMCQAIPR